MADADYKSSYTGEQVDRVVEKGLAAIKSVTIEGTTTEKITVPYGAITGTLANQTDLQNAFNAKQNTLTAGTNVQITGSTISATDTTYTAGTNVQIVNNTISATDTTYTAGTGINISATNEISATASAPQWGDIEGTLSSQTDLQAALDAKQDTLVSGTNIKTLNSTSLLGTGNLYIKPSSIVEPLETISASSIDLDVSKGVYSKTISADTTFTFNINNLGILTNKTIEFELFMQMPTVYSISFPSSVTWTTKANFLTAGNYLILFTSMDGGDTWIGEVKYPLAKSLNQEQVTNCILEDPQNINLTLSDGTITLKAGSVVVVPNGFESDGTTPKFDEVATASDQSVSSMSASSIFFTNSGGTSFAQWSAPLVYSGTTAPSGQTYMMWYDTTNNLVKITGDSGSTWASGYSFPVGIAHTAGSWGASTGIDQIFQSIGYIGSTVFVRKGLKVLIPNGRNDDGSLKNIEYTTSKVITKTLTSDLIGDCYSGVRGTNDIVVLYKSAWRYSEKENYVIDSTSAINYCSFICEYKATSGVISNFKPYTAINILKYSDSSQISGWGMPSSKYTTLTLGSSGTSYTSPANGWYFFSRGGGSSKYVLFQNLTKLYYSQSTDGSNSTNQIFPVSKGDVVKIAYNDGSQEYFRFYYAEGEI